MTWDEFYKGRLLSEGYRNYVTKRYAPFIGEIMTNMKAGDRVIEIGCGLATITSILAENAGRLLIDEGGESRECFAGFRCFDISPVMVKLARQNLYEGYPVDVGDARLPTNRLPDIIHSHGMLEHMSDEDIRAVIEASRKDGARVAIHYVPGEKYVTPSFGDERLMSLKAWEQICAPTEAYTFNDGYDYVLKWRF